MKRISQFLSFVLLFSMTFLLFAQEFEVPKNYRLEKKEDYAKYESDVLKCIEYIENTPLDDKSEKTKQAYVFFLKWITGSPSVTITVESYVSDLAKKNKDFLTIFLGGWTRYALQNSGKDDKMKGNVAGVESVIKVYKMGKGVKKDKKIDKLAKLQDEGKLEDWIKEQLKKTKQ